MMEEEEEEEEEEHRRGSFEHSQESKISKSGSSVSSGIT